MPDWVQLEESRRNTLKYSSYRLESGMFLVVRNCPPAFVSEFTSYSKHGLVNTSKEVMCRASYLAIAYLL